ncbi:MAG: ComEC/Rec2 family competence protein [Phaeodactylibacter xiamenensis]|nr:ComEC/Rec2 family competence protein [Phaeodactylibacter xiamenensis]MCR9053559.1 ComEC family competence protein [bacterium]
MNWRETPMLRLLLPTILGVGLARILPYWKLGLGLALVGIIALGFSRYRKWAFRFRWLPGAIITVVFTGLGLVLTVLHDTRSYAHHFQNQLREDHPAVLMGTVTEVVPAGQRLKVTLRTTATSDTTGHARPSAGKVLAYLDRPLPDASLVPGDRIMVRGKVQSVAPPLNPDQFDYRKYLAARDIHHQVFADTNWVRLEHQPGLMSVAGHLRTKALEILKQYLPTPNEYAVGAALTMGYKSALTEEIENAYANTGAMHVLAVSGLHVGLVQLILMWLLGRVPLRQPWWKIVKTGLIIAGIWAFALLTGAAPSVLRASTMFSFLAVGLALQRTTNVYNTLAASALVLLATNPNLLYHVGFQLSYLAVLGIVYFQPRIYSLWHIENRIGDYLWQLSAVSLAAQLGTLPISLYYFHQFPLYFVLSGLIVVPAAGLILSLTLLLLAFHSVPVLGALIAKVLYGLIYLVNAGIFVIQQLPGGLLEGIWMGSAGAWGLYALLVGLVLGHRTRQFRWVLGSLLLGALMAGGYAWEKWVSSQQQSIVIYQVYKHTAVDVFHGNHITQITSPAMKEDRLAFACEAHRWRRRASVDTLLSPRQSAKVDAAAGQKGYWQLGETRLLVLEDAAQLTGTGSFRVDAVVLSQSPKVRLAKVLERINTSCFIADGSNPPWRAAGWSEEAKALGLAFYYTAQTGAVTLENGIIESWIKNPAE